MLTGDKRNVAERTAEALGITSCHAELLPGDKVRIVEEILSQGGPKKTTAFAGDGINDAPVLMRADIGIAMGSMGSDAAIEAADVVLMDDDPTKIAGFREDRQEDGHHRQGKYRLRAERKRAHSDSRRCGNR